MLKILSVDFDGVIHSYTSKWIGAHVIPDPPVDGAIQWIRDVIDSKQFAVHIFSSRNAQIGGVQAMNKYLIKHGLEETYLRKIRFPARKPPAHLTIDDRGYHFDGTFPSVMWRAAFTPWNRKTDGEI